MKGHHESMLSLLLVIAMALACVLAGCGAEGEGVGASEGGDLTETSTKGDAREEAERQDEGTEQTLDWLSYSLVVDELREIEDSDTFQLDDLPSGTRYVVVRLLSAEGEIRSEDVTEQAASIHLRASSGDDFGPYVQVMWGVAFDPETGFSTKDVQEGFYLLFTVPKDITLQELRVDVQ